MQVEMLGSAVAGGGARGSPTRPAQTTSVVVTVVEEKESISCRHLWPSVDLRMRIKRTAEDLSELSRTLTGLTTEARFSLSTSTLL